MRRPPTAGSFSMAVLTRVVIVVSSMASETVLPQPAARGRASRNASVHDVRRLLSSRITTLRAGEVQPTCPAVAALGTANGAVSGMRRRPHVPSPSVLCRELHTGHVEPGVNHQHLAGDAPGGVTQEKGRGITDFGGVDVAAQ